MDFFRRLFGGRRQKDFNPAFCMYGIQFWIFGVRFFFDVSEDASNCLCERSFTVEEVLKRPDRQEQKEPGSKNNAFVVYYSQ